MSLYNGAVRSVASPSPFHRARPQILRSVLRTLDQAIAATARRLGEVRIHEPRFTRQLLLDLEAARDADPRSPRYDITHQPELPIPGPDGKVESLRRLDLRLLFPQQVGRTGDYLCLECKYIDTTDVATDREYVEEGVDRIVVGDYARLHPWAVMVGLERSGPIAEAADRIAARLTARYGAGFVRDPEIRLPFVWESDHLQNGGPHCIRILHSLHLIRV